MTANLCHDPADAASSDRQASERQESATDSTASQSEKPDVAVEEVLALLGDEYACDILRALDDGPMPATDLVDTCGMSRPTVYRRLDRLIAAGIVESRMRPDRNGHHRQVFHLVLDEIEFRVDTDGVSGAVRAADPDSA